MALIVFFLWRTMKLMPRTKPQEIKPDSDGLDQVGRGRRRRRGQGRAAGGRRLPARPGALPASSARRSPRASCCTARPAPARRCWPRRSPTSPARSSSRSRRRASSRCSPASAPPASGACSTRRASTRPAIVFIDEIDAVGAARGSDNNSEREQTLNQLLVEMDGFASSGELVVIAASNLLEKLDPALLRPGRFDRQILVSPPDVAGREAILEGPHAQQAARRGRRLRRSIARQTAGLTGADLANIANEAAIAAARGQRTQLEQEDFDSALERVVAGMQTRARAQRARAPRDRLPRGRPRAAAPSCCPASTARTRSRSSRAARRSATCCTSRRRTATSRRATELMDQMTVLLGGRAAEEIVFGSDHRPAPPTTSSRSPRSRAG